MPKFEPNSPKWTTKEVYIVGENVAKVAFNKAAKTTEITMKSGATYIAVNGFGFETDTPSVIPVKGTVAQVKKQLGL